MPNSPKLITTQNVGDVVFEVYEDRPNELRHRLTAGGKLLLEAYNNKVIPFLQLCQRAYYNVFVWDDDIHIKDGKERQHLLSRLQDVARTFSPQDLRQFGEYSVMLDIDGHSVKCSRFHLKDQEAIRSYYSVITTSYPVPGLEMEHRHVIAEITDISSRPTPLIDMASKLVHYIPKYK